ncbi:DUF1622 domain-containing protein [Dietzia maris]|uniref:DUF1622 domain-containing protein n=1 Tax=Dietzia maris TaxID=37915 RepID=UPI00232E330A|nr:DUF1622 domain-containing protein [Dietzia maris]
MPSKEYIEAVGEVIDALGVAAIVIGIVAATVIAGWRLLSRQPDTYRHFRRFLGRSILLGLEILVAADIIKTVAVTPTLESVAVLAAIVVIRTFLSWSLELEISGRWPWQKSTTPEAKPRDAAATSPVPSD